MLEMTGRIGHFGYPGSLASYAKANWIDADNEYARRPADPRATIMALLRG